LQVVSAMAFCYPTTNEFIVSNCLYSVISTKSSSLLMFQILSWHNFFHCFFSNVGFMIESLSNCPRRDISALENESSCTFSE